MEKVKGLFSKIGSGVKSHLKVVIAVVVIIIVAILAVNLVGGSEKRAVKKYLSALNSYEKDKIVKAMDLEGAIAWDSVLSYGSVTEDTIEDFEDALDDVDDDSKDTMKDSIKESAKTRKESKIKYKLLSVVYSTTAKDNKNIKKVVFKYKVTTKATDDDKDEAEDNDIWKKVKAYNTSATGYGTAYLYKNKVIDCSLYY